jgi:thiol-disulfide isomerase/thioredoxin
MSLRRSMAVGLCVSAFISATKAQIANFDDAPPILSTARSQFVELRPLRQVPDLVLRRIDGKIVALNDFRGKAVLVNFWATWCPPCRRELPLLDKLQQASSRRPFEIMAISIDQGGWPVVKRFLKQLNVTHLRPYLDAEGRIAKPVGSEAPTPFILWGMPISYIIDQQGRLAGYITGEVDWTSDRARALMNYYAGGY